MHTFSSENYEPHIKIRAYHPKTKHVHCAEVAREVVKDYLRLNSKNSTC